MLSLKEEEHQILLAMFCLEKEVYSFVLCPFTLYIPRNFYIPPSPTLVGRWEECRCRDSLRGGLIT